MCAFLHFYETAQYYDYDFYNVFHDVIFDFWLFLICFEGYFVRITNPITVR